MSQEPPSHHDSWNPPAVHELDAEFPALEIHSLLARGGMSAVYLAQQKSLERGVVLKILAPEAGNTEAAAERFQREARILARLRDPGIVEIYDSGVSPSGYLYLILEYVAGGDLRQWARRGSVSLDDVLSIGGSVAAALSAAHSAGVVHGDIKPDNVFIDLNGRLKVGDFGIADFAESVQSTHYTPGYTAPEILDDTGRVTPLSDIYAVAVMMAELLFPGLRVEDTAERDARVATLPDTARWALQRALEADPRNRPATAAGFQEELAHARGICAMPSPSPGSEGDIQSSTAGHQRRAGRRREAGPGERRRARMMALAAAAAGGVGLLLWKPWAASPPPLGPVAVETLEMGITTTPPPPVLPASTAETKVENTATDTPASTLEAPSAPSQEATASASPVGDPDTSVTESGGNTPDDAKDSDYWLAIRNAGTKEPFSKTFLNGPGDEKSIRAWNADWRLEAPMEKESNAARFDHPEQGRPVLMLSPFSTEKPSVFSRSISLPPDQPMQLSARVGCYWGERADWELRAFADGKALGAPLIISTTMPQGRFRDVAWDLTPWRGKTVELRVEGASGGKESWFYEFSYWAGLDVEPLRRQPPSDASMDPAQSSTGSPEPGFVDLLDAAHVGHWKAAGPGGLVLWKGAATTFTRPVRPAVGLCWYSGKPFNDYVLRMEFRPDNPQANSGVLISCPRMEDDFFAANRNGAVEIDIAGYEVKKLGTASIAWSKLPTALPMKRDDWNQYEIMVTGSKCRVRLNGQDVNEYDAKRNLSGYIALQHQWGGGGVRFRNIHIKELEPSRPEGQGTLPAAGTLAATSGKIPPEAGEMIRKLRVFATERRAALQQSISIGRRQLAGTFRAAAKGSRQELFNAEARRVDQLDAGKSLLDEDGMRACTGKGGPDFLGEWRSSDARTVFTYGPDGAGSNTDRGSMQWRLLDEDPERLLVVHWGPKGDWVNLGHFTRRRADVINWDGNRFQRMKIAETAPLRKPGMEWIIRAVRQEHEAADKTARVIEEKAEWLREWLRVRLKSAPVLNAALAQVDAVSPPPALPTGTPEDQRNPEGVWVTAEHRLEFNPGGELMVDRSIAGKWIWALDDFQRTAVAFRYDTGGGRMAGLARLSSKDDNLMRVHMLTGPALGDARKEISPGSPVGAVVDTTVPARKLLLGKWSWHGVGKAVKIEFLPDGKVIHPVADDGSWKQVGNEEDRCFEFHWNNGTDIAAVLSEDGLGIDAVQSDGSRIKGVKIVKP